MDNPAKPQAAERISSMMLLQTLAYVRPVETEQGTHYAVCAGDGTQLALFETRESAYFAAKQHDMQPTIIH